MQKTEHHRRLPRLPLMGKVSCIIDALLILVGASVCTGEPVMTLAMNQPARKMSVTSPAHPTADTNGAFFNLKSRPPEKTNQNNEQPVVLAPIISIEKQTNSAQLESLLVVRENSRSSKPLTVQAGYGQIWDDKSTLQKICCDHQEPGCAYVSANFSF